MVPKLLIFLSKIIKFKKDRKKKEGIVLLFIYSNLVMRRVLAYRVSHVFSVCIFLIKLYGSYFYVNPTHYENNDVYIRYIMNEIIMSSMQILGV